MDRLKVVVIGAGIVGASIARVMSRFENFEVTIVEKELDVGWGASKANTSVIHPGHEEDPRKHPLRAKLCKEGNALWRRWVEELQIPSRWPGELMIFYDSEEEKRARKFLELAKLNGVPGVRLIDRDELLHMEPLVNPEARGALYAPTAGLVSPFEAVVAIVENAVENGVRLLTEAEVREVKVVDGEIAGVETTKGFVEADIVVNAAGVHADEIARMAGVEPDFRITPRRGEYLLFDEDVPVKPKRVLHTTPTPVTKGVYAVTTVHGNLMVGPTAEDLPPSEKEAASTTRRGLEYLWRASRRLFAQPLPRKGVIRTFAGLRPEPSTGDWLIKAYEEPWGFVNVAGIRSPGLTGAPAIARYVVELVSKVYGVKLVEKEKWNPRRRDIERVSEKPLAEVDKLVEVDPGYGEIVCYCREVSRAEVVEAVRRILRIGAKVTLDGVKFRTRAGLGRCQGSFCRWRVALIVSQITGTPLHDVVVKRAAYGIGDVKALLRGGSA